MRAKPIDKRVSLAPIEREARALGARVSRQYHFVTPSLEGVVDLLVTNKSRRIVFEAELTLDLLRWDAAKAMALKADVLQILFPSDRLAHTAQKHVDEMKASGKAAKLSILCLTVDAAVRRFKDTNGFEFDLNVPPTSSLQNPPRNPRGKLSLDRTEAAPVGTDGVPSKCEEQLLQAHFGREDYRPDRLGAGDRSLESRRRTSNQSHPRMR